MAKLVCAQCGSSLSSSEGTEEFCLACLLQTALAAKISIALAEGIASTNMSSSVVGMAKPVALGRGAMGVTYRAFDTNLHCEVALR